MIANVLVVLGPKGEPATVTTWPKERPSMTRRQHLSPDERDAMAGNQTMLWEGELIEDHWWLSVPVTNTPPIVLSENEVPF